MTYSFRTNGNFIDFVHMDATSLQVENVLKSLHNTSRCVDWSLPEDTTRIDFTIDEDKYKNILITEIDFDGTAMNSQDDFETNIETMFPGIAGGGSSYLVYVALLPQSGIDAPVADELQNTVGAGLWSRSGVGRYACLTTTDFTGSKIWVSGLSQTPGDTQDYVTFFGSDGTFLGSYALYFQNVGGKIEINLDFNTDTGSAADISSVLAATFNLPEIRVYQ